MGCSRIQAVIISRAMTIVTDYGNGEVYIYLYQRNLTYKKIIKPCERDFLNMIYFLFV